MGKFGALLLVGGVVTLTTYAQLAVKAQVHKAGNIPEQLSGKLRFLLDILFSPLVLSAFAAAFLVSVMWVFALTRLPLSVAYPIMSLTFPLVVVSAHYLFGDPLGWPQIVGLFLIFLGVVAVNWSMP